MGDYHIFPPARSSEITHYNSRPLPRIPSNHPSQIYVSDQNRASYESILDHSIPSSSFDKEEIHQIWSRASQHSIISEIALSPSNGLARTDSLATVPENPTSARRRPSTRLPPLLPAALEYQYDHQLVEGVPCRLSSASTEDLSFAPSAVAAKRSATPDLLHKLSTDLEGLSVAETTITSTAPTTPNESFSDSIFNSPIYHHSQYSANSSSTTLDMAENSSPPSPKTLLRKPKPSNIFTTSGSGYRNISSPLPSPLYTSNHSPLLRTNTNESAVDPSYRPLRPAPLAPGTSNKAPPAEVSCMEWDDDDLSSKLARMKKSIGDLRAAASRTPKSTTKDRKIEKVAITVEHEPMPHASRPRAQRSMTAPTQAQIPVQIEIQPHTPPRPSLQQTASSNRLRTSLPVLPTRNPSVRAAVTSSSHSDPMPTQNEATQRINRKISVRVAAAASTPTRKRATSDAPTNKNLSLFPSTPMASPSTRSSKTSPSSTVTPSSSPRSTTTAATTVSNGTTILGSPRSRGSSVASMSLNDKPLPNPHAAAPKHAKRRAVKPALGNKRFSVLSFVSVRSSNTRTKSAQKPVPAPRTRVIGLARLRRWFRWMSRASRIPTVASSTALNEHARRRQVSSPLPSASGRTGTVLR